MSALVLLKLKELKTAVKVGTRIKQLLPALNSKGVLANHWYVATITAVKTSDQYPIEVKLNDNTKASWTWHEFMDDIKMECYDSSPNKARNERIEVTTCWGN